MAKRKYYSTENIRKHDADYNIIYGGRNNGKSYDVKCSCLLEAIENPEEKKIVYLRRYDMDAKATNVSKYYGDVSLKTLTKGKYSDFMCYTNDIFLVNRDKKGKVIDKLHVGYYMGLSNAEHYKSLQYKGAYNVIFEEFITTGMYLNDEPTELLHFISTIARGRKMKVWLVGNPVSPVCPYMADWGLTNLNKQAKGTIEDYVVHTGSFTEDEETGLKSEVTIKISVEYTSIEGADQTTFGKARDSIQGGDWEIGFYPIIDSKPEKTDIMYTMFFWFDGFLLKGELVMEKDGTPCWYIKPASKHCKMPKETDRVVSEKVCPSMTWTTRLTPLAPSEDKAFHFMKLGCIKYSDRMTGSIFEKMLKKM